MFLDESKVFGTYLHAAVGVSTSCEKKLPHVGRGMCTRMNNLAPTSNDERLG